MTEYKNYAAFLRGINLGNKHKLPMAELRKEMAAIGFTNVKTLLNSGNVVFKSPVENISELEQTISSHLSNVFKFPVPAMVIDSDEIKKLVIHSPFIQLKETETTRFYVTFCKNRPEINRELPWSPEENTLQILEIRNRAICSTLDLEVSHTIKGMELLEKLFGKNITTRNWNTVIKISDLF